MVIYIMLVVIVAAATLYSRNMIDVFLDSIKKTSL